MFGRPTKECLFGIKVKTMVNGSQPTFNKSDYADIVNKDGTHIFLKNMMHPSGKSSASN